MSISVILWTFVNFQNWTHFPFLHCCAQHTDSILALWCMVFVKHTCSWHVCWHTYNEFKCFCFADSSQWDPTSSHWQGCCCLWCPAFWFNRLLTVYTIGKGWYRSSAMGRGGWIWRSVRGGWAARNVKVHLCVTFVETVLAGTCRTFQWVSVVSCISLGR
jgi:hypothetical protein